MTQTRKYILSFPQELTSKPITYSLIKEFDLRINILHAEISASKKGFLLVDISGEQKNIDNGFDFLKQQKVEFEPFKKQLDFKIDDCVHCGSCIGVCHSKALYLEETTRTVNLNSQNCTVCGLCIDACPLQLFSINLNLSKYNAN
ncbi:MAG: NIL domain-containing protein [Bacteroidota bacterium]|nr:NIL domain-containing protein [Bacteroidota bacterium]